VIDKKALDEAVLAAVKRERPMHKHLARRHIINALGSQYPVALVAESLQRLQAAERVHHVVYGVSGWCPNGWTLTHGGRRDESGRFIPWGVISVTA